MKAIERQNRIRQIERVVATLQKKGWYMEQIQHTDAEDEPFRSSIHLSCTPESTDKSII